MSYKCLNFVDFFNKDSYILYVIRMYEIFVLTIRNGV